MGKSWHRSQNLVSSWRLNLSPAEDGGCGGCVNRPHGQICTSERPEAGARPWREKDESRRFRTNWQWTFPQLHTILPLTEPVSSPTSPERISLADPQQVLRHSHVGAVTKICSDGNPQQPLFHPRRTPNSFFKQAPRRHPRDLLPRIAVYDTKIPS